MHRESNAITDGVKIPTEEEMYQALEFRHTKRVQERLKEARVAICGLGGLGSAIAMALARSGIGHLHLIDYDKVDLSNLNRQQYSVSQLGMPKAAALKEELLRFAPYLDIVATEAKITPGNVHALLSEWDYICEAFDCPEEKAMLTNEVLVQLPDKELVGASGMAGYGNSNAIRTRKVMEHYYLCGDGVTEITDDFGLMAPRVMICAAHQANQIVSLIMENDN